MSKLYNNIKNHPHYAKALHWGKLISVTGSAQIIVQAVGFVSGILVIRMLPVEEYAIYTLANTMLGTMTVLSDGGISTGVMAQGGKVWQDREKLGAVLATGLDLRRKFAIGSLIISIPILAYLLHTHGASWLTIILITVSLIPAFFAALSDTLLQIPAKLHQAILPLQRNQVEVGIGRLVLTGISIFAFPWAFVAVLASGIPRMYGNIKLRKIANVFVDKEQEPNLEVREDILKVVKRVLPGSVYYAVSGQITIWLISIFGNSENIAKIGAISRLMLVFGILTSVFSTVIFPYFSKIPDISKLIINAFLKILTLGAVLSLFSIVIVAIFPKQLLFILGRNYLDNSFILLLMTIGACLSFMSSMLYGLLACRAIIANPIYFFSCIFITQILCIVIFDMTEVEDVLMLSIFPPIVGSILRIVHFFNYIRKNYDRVTLFKD